MELQKFIFETITAIVKAKKQCEEHSILFKDHDSISIIDFDIALTVTNTSGSEAGGKINIAGVSLGKDGKKEETASHISRIKFKLSPVELLSQPN